jgi:hypothetical protein
LKYHAEFAANFQDILTAFVDSPAALIRLADIFIVYLDASKVGDFKMVEATKKRTFAGAGRTDNGNDIPTFYTQIDALEHLELSEFLMQIFCSNYLHLTAFIYLML